MGEKAYLQNNCQEKERRYILWAFHLSYSLVLQLWNKDFNLFGIEPILWIFYSNSAANEANAIPVFLPFPPFLSHLLPPFLLLYSPLLYFLLFSFISSFFIFSFFLWIFLSDIFSIPFIQTSFNLALLAKGKDLINFLPINVLEIKICIKQFPHDT